MTSDTDQIEQPTGAPGAAPMGRRERFVDDPRKKSVMLAMLLSGMPGLGQVYVGYYNLAFRNILVILRPDRDPRDRGPPRSRAGHRAVPRVLLAAQHRGRRAARQFLQPGPRRSPADGAAGRRQGATAGIRFARRRRAAHRRGTDALCEHDVSDSARLARPVVAAGSGRRGRLAHLRRPACEGRGCRSRADRAVTPPGSTAARQPL